MRQNSGTATPRPVPVVEELVPEPPEEPLHRRVVGQAVLLRHRSDQVVPLADPDPAGPPVVVPPVRVDDGTLVPPPGVPHTAFRLSLASLVSGLVPMDYAGSPPSKQSIIGDRLTLPPGRPNSVMSVSHSLLGASAANLRPTRFSGASDISPLYELYLAFFLA